MLLEMTAMSAAGAVLLLLIALFAAAPSRLGSCANTTSTNSTDDKIGFLVGAYVEMTLVGIRDADEVSQALQAAFQQASQATKAAAFTLRQLDSLADVTSASDQLDAVFSVSSCAMAHGIANNVTQAGVLHVALVAGWCPRHSSSLAMVIPVLGEEQNLLQLLVDLRLADTLDWRDMTVVHDDSVNPLLMEQIVNVMVRGVPTYANTLLSTFRLPQADADSARRGLIYDALKPIDPKRMDRPNNNYMVFVRDNSIKTVMSVARSLNLTGLLNQWLFVLPNTDVTKFGLYEYLDEIRDGDNVAFLYNMAAHSISANCKESLYCLLRAMVFDYVAETEAAVARELDMKVLLPEEEWAELEPSREERNARVADRVRHLVQRARNDSAGAYECYACRQWGAHSVEVTGPTSARLVHTLDWRPTFGLVAHDDLFLHVRGGMRRRRITVTALHYPPWSIFNRDAAGNVVGYSGFMFQVLNEIAKQMNFTYQVTPPADGKWGVRDKASGTWNGMMEMIRRKEALIGVASMVVTDERRAAVSFTETIDRQPYAFMYERPQELSRALIFVEPFTPRVWILILLVTVLIGPLLWIMTKASLYYRVHGYRTDRGLFSLSNCVWYAFGAILQQGGIHLPDALSGRMLVGTWWLFVLVVVTSYSGNLVAFLTFPKTDNPLNSLQDLVDNSGSISWGALAGTYLETYLTESDVELHQQLRKGLVLHESTNEVLLDDVRAGKHVFMDWETNLRFLMKESYIKTQECDFSLSREKFFEELVAMPVQKNSIYLPMFNTQIKRILEVGLTKKWKQMYWPKEDECSSTAEGGGDTNRTVNIVDMQGSFYVLVVGFFVALLLILGECCISRRGAGQSFKDRWSGTAKKLTAGGKDVIYPFVA